ncbi:NUDIX domain-containing protein [Desertivirga arenae]|uniref:NUDIX domain-containing protein n=1 Tax=Desertivirga arenae TaxID=2810309 RepID=UPI001A9742BC|nr:NUDIX domain-containing protein [Pedobacter sp. SYSU D00823]
MKYTAGIWAYRRAIDGFQVLLVHPGGPFYIKKDEGVWSVPKGEFDPAIEQELEVAKREFNEETGNKIITEDFIVLSPVKTKGGKMLKTWATETDFEKPFISSNLFEMEWPPKSGRKKEFPETDKAEWFSFEQARIKLNASQLPVLDELEQILKSKCK